MSTDPVVHPSYITRRPVFCDDSKTRLECTRGRQCGLKFLFLKMFSVALPSVALQKSSLTMGIIPKFLTSIGMLKVTRDRNSLDNLVDLVARDTGWHICTVKGGLAM